jgi:flagellin
MSAALTLDLTNLPVAPADDALSTLDTAIGDVSSLRADLGAKQSRLESSVNTMTSNATNLSDARSRIEDTDYSTETAALAKAQILSQASTAMLSQANQSQQNVLSLLR